MQDIKTITIDAPDIKGRKRITYKRGEDGFFYLKNIQTDDGMDITYIDGEGRIGINFLKILSTDFSLLKWRTSKCQFDVTDLATKGKLTIQNYLPIST